MEYNTRSQEQKRGRTKKMPCTPTQGEQSHVHVSLSVESASGDVGLGDRVMVVVRMLTDFLNSDNTVHRVYPAWDIENNVYVQFKW